MALNGCVVVTGLGPLCALGRDVSQVWESVLHGRSGIQRLAPLGDAPVDLGSRVPDTWIEDLDPREKRLDRVVRLALGAARAGLRDAGLLGDDGRYQGASERAGVVLGTSRGAASMLELSHAKFLERGAKGVSPRASPLSTIGGLSASVAQHVGLRGPNLTVSAACSSSSQAIGMAFDQVRLGRADVMVAGGAEACLRPFCISMFDAAGILSHWSGDPASACRPFDRRRDGTVVGEGAGVVVIESLDHARRRGASVHARLTGFGASCDAHSLTGMPEDGGGLVRAAEASLCDAGVELQRLGAIGAHGTGTRLGDRTEIAAYRKLTESSSALVPVVALKSLTGHLLGAAGAVEAICAVLALERRLLPPARNIDEPEPGVDVVRGQPRPLHSPWILTSSMGFGGNNACLVFGPRP